MKAELANNEPLAFDRWGGESIGRRTSQQDYRLAVAHANRRELLLVVTDGMGGHVGGAIASHTTATAFADCFINNTVGASPRRLRIALAMANEALTERIRSEPELDGMGTTLVAAHLGPQGLAWVSVGDSLLLRLRGDEISRLNADHSMVPVIERRFEAGQMTRAEADAHPERSELLSVLTGWYSPSYVDCPEKPLELITGDRIILASDGLQTLEMPEIAAALAGPVDACVCVEHLFAAIAKNARELQDNTAIELVIVR